jgi:hypothetical protein
MGDEAGTSRHHAARLLEMAEYYGYLDLKTAFEEAISNLPPAAAAEIKREPERWNDGLLHDIRDVSWRNQR